MDDKLDKLKKIRKVEPPPFLFTRIQERIRAQDTVPVLWKWSFAVAAMVMIVFNVAVVVKSTNTQGGNGINEMVSALHLSASNNLYNE